MTRNLVVEHILLFEGDGHECVDTLLLEVKL